MQIWNNLEQVSEICPRVISCGTVTDMGRVTIKEAAKDLGVSAKVLRNWEKAGLVKEAVLRTPGGHRRYDLRELHREIEEAARRGGKS